MSTLAVSPSLADACPRCHPGDAPAAVPREVCIDDVALCVRYTCPVCGQAWRTWWELAAVWPVRRESVEPATALLDRLIAVLANALDGEEMETASGS